VQYSQPDPPLCSAVEVWRGGGDEGPSVPGAEAACSGWELFDGAGWDLECYTAPGQRGAGHHRGCWSPTGSDQVSQSQEMALRLLGNGIWAVQRSELILAALQVMCRVRQESSPGIWTHSGSCLTFSCGKPQPCEQMWSRNQMNEL